LNDEQRQELREKAAGSSPLASAGLSPAINASLVPAIKTDAPITSSSQDRLNRTGLATAIARAILTLDAKESVVIGIYGPWGTGKTSLLNLLQEQLDETQSTIPTLIMRFNPWDFSDQNQLVAQFFNDLSAFLRLHETIPLLSKIADVVEEYGKLLDPLARLVAPRLAEISKLSWLLFRKAKPRLQRTNIDLKAQINSVFRVVSAKLVILVDDVDRLNASEIRQVFQLVKLNANFTNTVYVVAFNKASVEKALEEVSPGLPGEYLEKIVQVAFVLPPIGETKLTQLMTEEFDHTLLWFKVPQIDEQRFGNMFFSGFRDYFRTLRDVTRFFNLFRFSLAMIAEDTNFIDLAVIEAFALFESEFFIAIQSHSDLFVGSIGYQDRQRKPSLTEQYDKLLKAVPEERRERVVSLCRFLFPKMEYVYSNTTYGPEWEQQWERDRRVASSRYFPFYFQLAVPEGEVSRVEMARALGDATSVEHFVAVLDDFNRSGRFAPFVDLLRHFVPDLEREKLLVILESIFVYGDHVSTTGTGAYGMISDHLRFTSWLLQDILDALKADRFGELIRKMRGQPAVYTIVNTTSFFRQLLTQPDQAAHRQQKYPDLGDAVVDEMTSIALDAINSAARKSTLSSAPNLPLILYRWKEWGEASQVDEWIDSTFLQHPLGSIALLEHFSQPVRSYGLGDRVAKVRTTISVKALADFVDLNRLADLLQVESKAEISEKQKKLIKIFMRAKARIDKGSSPESVDVMFPRDDDEDV
jgi:predicted KAP-like P-loop ATPase